jgi:probable rRNA maturation factor
MGGESSSGLSRAPGDETRRGTREDAGSSAVIFNGAPPRVRRRPLREFARQLQAEVAGGRAFECLIAGDLELARLNARWRNRRRPADVLSFPAARADSGYLGEIAISWERAGEQAPRYGHTREQEIRILMLHGLLHLLGYDHERDGGRMARAERRWRSRLGLGPGLIERTSL